ncbi:MAG: DUF4446 family protein [Desulfitobacteriia bacterium]
MDIIFNINEQTLLVIGIAAALLALFSIILSLVLLRKLNKFKKAYLSLQTFMSGANLDDTLKSYQAEVREINQKIATLDRRLDRLENKSREAVDCIEILKFNSFAYMGGDLSFTLAFLNQEGSGLLLTGIQSIEECRVYAKALDKGNSSIPLSPEEKKVVEKACAKLIKV